MLQCSPCILNTLRYPLLCEFWRHGSGTSSALRLFIRCFLSAFKACKELQAFDIINAHLYPSNVVASRVKGPVKVFVEWSTVDPARFSEYAHERLYARLLVSGNRYAARRADHLLVPSGFVRSWVEENFGLRSVQMLLDGINFDLFDRGRVTPSIVHENFPELKDGKMVLFVGRIAPNKGIEQLVRSFAEVRESSQRRFSRNCGRVDIS